MQQGALGAAHRLNDFLHLLTGSAWLGGLIPFVLCVRICAEPRLRAPAVSAMMRYSKAGHVFVPVVAATGAINVALDDRRPSLAARVRPIASCWD